MTIIETYTKIIKSIYSCTTLNQLESCQQMIPSMAKFQDRSDLAAFVQSIDREYMIKKNEIMESDAKAMQVPIINSMYSAMTVVSDVGAMCDEHEPFTDIIN